MKINILLMLAVLLIPLAATRVMQQTPPPARTAEAMPAFSFTDTNGVQHHSTDFVGKIVFVNFWASWCAPCVVEFPHLLKLAADNRDDIVLIALSSDTSAQDMNKFLAKHKIPDTGNILIGLDDGGAITRETFKTFKLPETYIFDKQGNRHYKMIGADWDPKDIQLVLHTLLFP